MEKPLTNRLSEASSPYLLQHADNPVAWQPWDEDALLAARELDRPILLSSGYSSCHWCHVMAHESFEDPETAELMNTCFVNIKLDREERPDIDMVYQTAHHLMTQRSGGWPLTAFLSPHTLRPFFCGTYFPDTPRHNLPSFKEVLTAVAEHSRNNTTDEIGAEVQTALRQIYTLERAATEIPGNLSDIACDSLIRNADLQNGGFGGAPKFPQTDLLQCLLRQCTRTSGRNTPAEKTLRLSLKSFCQLGLYDHLGGGFFRYCVDDMWSVPHFEKMLYDNGQLLGLLADAHCLFGDMPFIVDAATATAAWLERDMQSDEGGYYAALDADNAEGEGAFYTWSPEDIRNVLEEDEARCFIYRFGLDNKPNYEGKWHLRVVRDDVPDNILRNGDTRHTPGTFSATIQNSTATLLKQRTQRAHPGLDNKCLTAWNALAIKGMAKTARAFGKSSCLTSAERALHFIREHMWHNNRLYAVFCKEKMYGNAFLNDYAYLADALLHMLQCRWRDDDLKWACEIADCIIRYFEDDQHGGYYFTAHDAEQPVQRPVSFYDDAQPSGYGIATQTLARLGHLCGIPEYLRSAGRAIACASATLAQAPAQCSSLLFAYEEQLRPPRIVIIRSDNDDAAWRNAAYRLFNPYQLTFIIPPTASGLPASLAARQAVDGDVAYVCEGTQCLPPATTPAALSQLLSRI